MEPFLGQIQAFPYNYAPRGWAQCQGQIVSIAEHQSLFALLGTAYGGDGRTNFGLPDLRGRVPVGIGQAPGIPMYVLGEKGSIQTTLIDGGDGDSMNNGQPFLAINWCIAITGVWPKHN